MTRQDGLYQWTAIVTTHLPHLSAPQARVLALWSFGMVLVHSCALTAVAGFLADLLTQKENTLRQRLREWCYPAQKKRGAHRCELDVQACFVPLLCWVMSWWHGQQLALALDATLLGDVFAVLAVSVVYRGCAIPVAWIVLPANQKGEWRRHWLHLLRLLRPAIPRSMFVLVMADRGLYARWLYRRIVRLGWHPFLRINAGGTFCAEGVAGGFRRLSTFVPQAGTQWRGRGTAFKKRRSQLSCTLLAYWQADMAEAWLILTDLAPVVCDVAWYGLRAWIEQGFKITKRGGWQWQRTRMTDPERASRLWLAVAVATLWLLSVGGEAEETIPESTFPDLMPTPTLGPGKKRRPVQATRLRITSAFRRGWVRLLVALLGHEPLPEGRFIPEPWPESRPLAEVAII